jgi:hypothetical protein
MLDQAQEWQALCTCWECWVLRSLSCRLTEESSCVLRPRQLEKTLETLLRMNATHRYRGKGLVSYAVYHERFEELGSCSCWVFTDHYLEEVVALRDADKNYAGFIGVI